jgi:predicted permease
VPGVDTLALSDSLPPAGTPRSTIYSVIGVEGRPRAPEGTGGMVVWRAVTPGYFSALGIPIVQGRGLTEEDRRSDSNVTILSEALARRMFPGEDPLNKRIQPGGAGPWFTVVGIAGDVKNAGIESADQPEFYLVRKHLTTPFSEHDARFAGFLRSSHVILRTAMNPEAMTQWMRAEVAAIDQALPLTVETMTQRVGQLAQRPKFNALLLGLFAALGLALASIGLYGVVSFLVTERTQEIGIRMALGATPRGVAHLVLAQAARWTLLGTIAGLAGAALATRFLETLLFEVSGYDPLTVGVTVAVLAFVALVAAWIPARRAARVDPLAALRQE